MPCRRTPNDYPGKRPGYPFFFHEPVYAPRDRDYAEYHAYRAYRWRRKLEHTHLKWQQRKRSGNTADRSEERDNKSNDNWDERIDVDAGMPLLHREGDASTM